MTAADDKLGAGRSRIAAGAAMLAAALAAGLAAVPHGAPAAELERKAPPYVANEIVVGFDDGGTRVVELPAQTPVEAAADRLEERPGVAYAQPNWIATAADFPLDLGSAGVPRGWEREQWNLLGGPGGIRVRGAWRRARRAGTPGGAGTVVAVVDTGIAYTNGDGIAISPDFSLTQFVRGADLVDGDGLPVDENGHGTHVAGTIGEQVTLGTPSSVPDYLAGIAYGARLMPVRVLDARGEGTAEDVARGIRWAARRNADVINLSLQFARAVKSCADVPSVCQATREARQRGALVVAAAGNTEGGGGDVLYPAAAPGVLAVGATTEHGCLAAYSHFGPDSDLLAPGGGAPRAAAAKPRCKGDSARIFQLTYDCFPSGSCVSFDRFSIRSDLGTSMSAAHTSAVAALAEGSGVVGRNPSPRTVRRRLLCTARTLTPSRFYGSGLLDAGRALDRRIPCARSERR